MRKHPTGIGGSRWIAPQGFDLRSCPSTEASNGGSHRSIERSLLFGQHRVELSAEKGRYPLVRANHCISSGDVAASPRVECPLRSCTSTRAATVPHPVRDAFGVPSDDSD